MYNLPEDFRKQGILGLLQATWRELQLYWQLHTRQTYIYGI